MRALVVGLLVLWGVPLLACGLWAIGVCLYDARRDRRLAHGLRRLIEAEDARRELIADLEVLFNGPDARPARTIR